MNLLKTSIILLLMVCFSCSNPYNKLHKADFTPIQPAQKPQTTAPEEYKLQVGDVVDIKLFYNSELNQTVRVRPDGRISLQLIDEINAAGRTPAQLDEEITERYSKKLKVPDVTVIVREFSGRMIFVGGEVNLPGLISYSTNLTALMAIIQSGGFKRTAQTKNIVILRNHGLQNPSYKIVNLKKDLHLLGQQNDVLLRPYDIVYVPRTTISKINQFIDEYFRKLIPFTTNVGFNYMLWFNKESEVK